MKPELHLAPRTILHSLKNAPSLQALYLSYMCVYFLFLNEDVYRLPESPRLGNESKSNVFFSFFFDVVGFFFSDPTFPLGFFFFSLNVLLVSLY